MRIHIEPGIIRDIQRVHFGIPGRIVIERRMLRTRQFCAVAQLHVAAGNARLM